MAVFLSGQDLSPPFIKRILLVFELLLFLFQAPGCSNKLSLEAFLFEGFLWDDKIFVSEADLLFGFWHIVVVLRIFVISVFRAIFPLFPLVLFECGLDGVFGIFGIIRSPLSPVPVLLSFARRDCDRHRWHRRFGGLSMGLSSSGLGLSSSSFLSRVSTMYTS